MLAGSNLKIIPYKSNLECGPLNVKICFASLGIVFLLPQQNTKEKLLVSMTTKQFYKDQLEL